MIHPWSWLRGLIILAMLAVGVQSRAAEPVDLELVLAIDISGSIDPDEAKLQRDGYVNAFRDPQVIHAIRGGINGRIAVAYFEWASYHQMHVVMNWTMIQDTATAHDFADKLAAVPITRGMRTSISGAIEYALPMFERSGFEPLRRVLDISGDGPNNDGGLITIFRDRALAKGITINGLPIMNGRPNQWGFPVMPDLDLYFIGCVIGGPGAFVEVARSFEDFDRAVRRKLILEIAGLRLETAPPGGVTRWATSPPKAERSRRLIAEQPAYEKGCGIGERQSRDFWRNRSLN